MRAKALDSFAHSRTRGGSGFPRILSLAMACLALAPTSWGAEALPVSGSNAVFDWSAFLGPFHVVLLHFPIGFIAAAAVLEFFAWRHPSRELRFAVCLMLWITVVSGVVASLTGLLRASEGGFDAEAALEHRNHAYAFVGAAFLAAVASHFAGRTTATSRVVIAFRALLLLSLLLVGPAGHHGGNLTHGSDFLTAGAPQFIVKIFRPGAKSTVPSPSAPGGTNTVPSSTSTSSSSAPSAAQLYATQVKPLFESRCYACHGPEKHKGDYRLDLQDNALRGGESGIPGITPGDPMKSNVLRLMMLPRDHDDVMPPEGKQAPTPEEIMAVAHWIQAGAPFESSVP